MEAATADAPPVLGPVKIEEEGGGIRVECSLQDRDNMLEIPGATWDQKARVWRCRLSWAAMVQLRGVFGDRLEIGDRLIDMARKVKQYRIQPAMAMRVAEDASGHDERLTPLQRAGASFMAAARQALNADPQGSGKTPQTISALRALEEPFPALVVCPNSVKFHWRDEFATWGPGVEVEVVSGGAVARRKSIERVASGEAQVLVINWESVYRHTRLAGYGSMKLSDKDKEEKELNAVPWRTVIADEAHRSKNPSAKQTRGLWWLGDRATYRFALTGTPVANTPEDLWAIMRFVAPDEFPSKTRWIDRYGLLSWNVFGGLDVVGFRSDTREELFSFLDPRMIRRPKEVILPELEGKLPPIVREVELPAKQRKPYDALRKEMLAELEGGVLMATNPMVRIQRLRTLAGATGVLNDDGDLELTEPSSKIDALVEVIEDLAPEEKVAVYAESKLLVRLAAARLGKEKIVHATFTGDDSAEDREAARAKFQDRGDPLRVLLLTFGAGGEGINLSAADLLVFLEDSWSLIKQKQAEERPDRPGREGPLRTVHITALDTVDERVREALEQKGGVLEEVVRDEENLKKWLG